MDPLKAKIKIGKNVAGDFVEDERLEIIKNKFSLHFYAYPNIEIAQQSDRLLSGETLRVATSQYFTIFFSDGLFHSQITDETFGASGEQFVIRDFSNVKRLGKPMRLGFFKLIKAVKKEDYGSMARLLIQWSDDPNANSTSLVNLFRSHLNFDFISFSDEVGYSRILQHAVSIAAQSNINVLEEFQLLIDTISWFENKSNSLGAKASIWPEFLESAEAELNGDLLNPQSLNEVLMGLSAWKAFLLEGPAQLQSIVSSLASTSTESSTSLHRSTGWQIGGSIIFAAIIIAISLFMLN